MAAWLHLGSQCKHPAKWLLAASNPCVAAQMQTRCRAKAGCGQSSAISCKRLADLYVSVLQAAEGATDGTKAALGGEPEVLVASEHPLDELGAAASLKHEVSPRQRAPSAPLEASQEQEGEERSPAPAATAGGVPDQALEEAGRLVRS